MSDFAFLVDTGYGNSQNRALVTARRVQSIIDKAQADPKADAFARELMSTLFELEPLSLTSDDIDFLHSLNDAYEDPSLCHKIMRIRDGRTKLETNGQHMDHFVPQDNDGYIAVMNSLFSYAFNMPFHIDVHSAINMRFADGAENMGDSNDLPMPAEVLLLWRGNIEALLEKKAAIRRELGIKIDPTLILEPGYLRRNLGEAKTVSLEEARKGMFDDGGNMVHYSLQKLRSTLSELAQRNRISLDQVSDLSGVFASATCAADFVFTHRTQTPDRAEMKIYNSLESGLMKVADLLAALKTAPKTNDGQHILLKDIKISEIMPVLRNLPEGERNPHPIFTSGFCYMEGGQMKSKINIQNTGPVSVPDGFTGSVIPTGDNMTRFIKDLERFLLQHARHALQMREDCNTRADQEPVRLPSFLTRAAA